MNNPKLVAVLDFLEANDIKVAFMVHEDHGLAGENEAGRPAAIKSAYEHVEKMAAVFRAYPKINFVWAHTGIGRFVRANDHMVQVTVKGIIKQVPQQIAVLYKILETSPNVTFDLSWNDVTQNYADSPLLREYLVDLILEYPEHFKYGSDTVKPVNSAEYNQALYTASPVLVELALRDKEALWKVVSANSTRLFDAGAASVARWTRANLNNPKALAEMDARNATLARLRAEMRKQARVEFDKFVDKIVAEFGPGGKPLPSGNPGVFPALYELLPNGHDHPALTPNPKHGQVGTGTSGGHENSKRGSHPIATKASNKQIATAGASTAIASAAVAAGYGSIGAYTNSAAFAFRGLLQVLRVIWPKIGTEDLRIAWEEIFEEGDVTPDGRDAFVSRILNAAGPLKISEKQRAQVVFVTNQFWANYQALVPICQLTPMRRKPRASTRSWRRLVFIRSQSTAS